MSRESNVDGHGVDDGAALYPLLPLLLLVTWVRNTVVGLDYCLLVLFRGYVMHS